MTSGVLHFPGADALVRPLFSSEMFAFKLVKSNRIFHQVADLHICKIVIFLFVREEK